MKQPVYAFVNMHGSFYRMRVAVRVYIYVCVCVTGVQRGPVRGTEFKFQIWSVSQGVTVCIALPAGSNSLHRWCVFVPSLPLSFHCAYAAPPSSRVHPVYIQQFFLFLPFIYLDFSYYSKKGIRSYRSAKEVSVWTHV